MHAKAECIIGEGLSTGILRYAQNDTGSVTLSVAKGLNPSATDLTELRGTQWRLT